MTDIENAMRPLLDEMNRTLGRVEQNVANVKERIDGIDLALGSKINTLEKDHKDFKADFETSRAKIHGIALGLGIAGGAVTKLLGYLASLVVAHN